MKYPGGQATSEKGMELPTGHFFGQEFAEIRAGGLIVSTRKYEAGHEQPWHTHENPTFYVQLLGDHIDGSPHHDWQLVPLSVSYHPIESPHRSRLGPAGAEGINLETTSAWLERHGLSKKMFGPQTVSTSARAKRTGLRFVGSLLHSATVDIDSMAVELIESFVAGGTQTEAGEPLWLQRAEERLNAEFRCPIGLAQIASEAGVHSVHFARVFRRRHACSVVEYLQRLRLTEAVSLILEGRSCGEAAIEAGFVDQFYFWKVLKDHCGVGPRAIKKIGRQGVRCFES